MQGSYGEANEAAGGLSPMKYSGGFEDDKVASTVSYLSSFALRSLGSVDVPVEAGRVIEIPFREQMTLRISMAIQLPHWIVGSSMTALVS